MKAMKRIGILLLLCLGMMRADAAPKVELDGPAIAAQIRSGVPEEPSEIRGQLEISAPKSKKKVPVSCRVLLHEDSWETVYETAAIVNTPAEKLIVRHFPDKVNLYLFARAAAVTSAVPETVEITSDVANATRLAGSDFSLGELGMDFLHWPTQERVKLAKPRLKLGQECYLLESSRPGSNGVVRVRSYIDKDTDGLIAAEGFDAKGHVLKEFSLSGSSFTKVNGQWKLEKMEMQSPDLESVTVLRFDVKGAK